MSIRSSLIVGYVVRVRFWEGFLGLVIIRETQSKRIYGRYTCRVIDALDVPRDGRVCHDRQGCEYRDGDEEFDEGESFV